MASLALDAKGRFLGLKIDTDFAQGAYLTPSAGVPSGLGSLAYTNCYDIPAAHVLYPRTSTPTPRRSGPYRGAASRRRSI